MSFKKNQARNDIDLLMPAPWTDPAPLADIAGGETNLLHRSAWSDPGNPLKVKFDPWDTSLPSENDPETITVFLGGDEVGSKQWTAPISPGDHFVAISAEKLSPGRHLLTYVMTNWLGTSLASEPFTVTVDKQEPLLNGSNTLIFPAEILPPANKLTDVYLKNNDDRVKADVPPYTSPRPWDRITWYWGASPGDLNEGGVIELDDKNYADPVVLEVEGSLIRDRKDGLRYVSYRVHDRAGNPSVYSAFAELDVAATPIPRTLPWPAIEQAAGSGELLTFDPLSGTSGAIVVVPEAAVIYPGERVWVQWGEPGSLGASRVEHAITPGQRRYRIEMPSVAAHIGRTLTVDYGVVDAKGDLHHSVHRRLQVNTLPSNRLKAVSCDNLSGGNLSYKAVAVQGARLTLDTWPLMTTDHWVMITMTGVGTSGDTVYEAVRRRVVTERETTAGIGFTTDVRVPKTFLNSLRRNASLTGKVYVSFDGGKTWPPVAAPNFPLLQLTFID